jgi:hypothetical protein
MIVHLHDFQGLDVDLDVPDSSTVADLRLRLQADGLYDPSSAQFFKSRQQLTDSTVIATLDFSVNNVIVVLKRGAFGDQSFPTHQPPSEFGRSRLREFFIAPPSESSPQHIDAGDEDHGILRHRLFLQSDVIPFDDLFGQQLGFVPRGDGGGAPEEEDTDDGLISVFIAEMRHRGHSRRVIMNALFQSGSDLDAAEQILQDGQGFVLRMS